MGKLSNDSYYAAFNNLRGSLDEAREKESESIVQVQENALESVTSLLVSLNGSLELAQSLDGENRIVEINRVKEQLLSVLINGNPFGKWVPKDHNEVIKEEMWKILKAE